AAAGGDYIAAAEELAGTDNEALRAVAVTVGRTDLDRALALARRIKGGYERAAAMKVWRSGMTVCAELVAERAGRDPVGALTLLRQLEAAGRLRDADAVRALVATALRLGPVDGEATLALVDADAAEDPDELTETASGLVLAAAATATDADVRGRALEQWRRR